MSGGLVFLGWVRSGLSAAVQQASGSPSPLTSAPPARASLQVAIALGQNQSAGVIASIQGPGDVIGLDQHQIIRLEPPDGAVGVAPNYLPHIEFDQPELPWMASPAAPQKNELTTNPKRGALPWLCLVVTPAAETEIIPSGDGNPLPSIKLPLAELPDLGTSWLWAHAQVQLTDDETANDDTAKNAILGLLQTSSDKTLSRVLSVRRLKPNTRYLACLVPTFENGRLAGIGNNDTLIAVTSSAKAWDASNPDPNAERDANGQVLVHLPVYASWQFSTGETGDFKYLAELLNPLDKAQAGTRPLDLTKTMKALCQTTSPYLIDFEGALLAGDVVCGAWPAGSVPSQSEFQAKLAEALDGSPGFLPPPIYGARQSSPSFDDKKKLANGDGYPWLRELNLDPRYRVVAALGSRVIQQNREALMASAWQQAPEITEVNAILRKGRLAQELGARAYAKRIGDGAAPVMGDERLLQITSGIHAQLAAGTPPASATGAHADASTSQTVAARLAVTPAAAAATSVAFRRIARPSGPLARRLLPGQPLQVDVKPLIKRTTPVVPALKPVDSFLKSLTLALIDKSMGGAATKAKAIERDVATPAPVISPAFLPDVLFADCGKVAKCISLNGEPQIGWSDFDLSILKGGWQSGGVVWNTRVYDFTNYEKTNGVVNVVVATAGYEPRQTKGDNGFTRQWWAFTFSYATYSGDIYNVNVPGAADSWCYEQLPAPPASDLPPFVSPPPPPPPPPPPDTGPLTIALSNFDENGRFRDIIFFYSGQTAIAHDVGSRPSRWSNGGVSMAGTSLSPSDDWYRVMEPGFVGGAIARLDIGSTSTKAFLTVQYLLNDGKKQAIIRVGRDVNGDGQMGSWGPRITVPDDIASSIWMCNQLIVGPLSPDSAAYRRAALAAFCDAADAVHTRFQRIFALADPASSSPAAAPAASGASNSDSICAEIRKSIDPRPNVLASVNARLQLTAQSDPSALPKALSSLRPIVVAPTFSQPGYELMRNLAQEMLFTGASAFPDNKVTALASNAKFVEAFLAGLNHEMGRELLWRGFPADLTGTYFSRFWDRRGVDGSPLPDILPMGQWHQALGANGAGLSAEVLLVIRGALLRRLPNVVIFAAPAIADPVTKKRTVNPDPTKYLYPIFCGQLKPDIVSLGFALSCVEAVGTGTTDGYYFIFQEHPLAPRFGLAEPEPPVNSFGAIPPNWARLDWSNVVHNEDEYHSLVNLVASDASRLANQVLVDSDANGAKEHRWGSSAADMAHVLLRPPVMVARHASKLMNLQTVATPTFCPPPGASSLPQAVSIVTRTGNAVIYYTIDGSTPTASSSKYAGPIHLAKKTTIQAIATATGSLPSAVASATYPAVQS